MNSRVVAAAALAVATSLGAQDTRPATTLRLPPSSKSPVVADAAMKGDAAAVRRLIQQGANVDAAQGDGMTALHWAAERGDSAIAAALLAAKANVSATTRIGAYMPLHIAAKGGHVRIGFENNQLLPDGTIARDNAQLVAAELATLRDSAASMRPLASAAWVRAHLAGTG